MEIVHIATLLLTVLVILTADHQALQYIRGVRPLMSASFVRSTHRLVWVGLIGMIVSGVFLAVPRWSYLITELAFYVKMGFVLTLCVNAFFIEKLSRVATERPWVALTQDERALFYVSGALSVMGWVGAAVIGGLFL